MHSQPITAEYLDASLTLIIAAFATAEHSDGQEAALTKRLRTSATYQPAFDVIALSDDGQLIGHALLSQAMVADRWPVAVLAPLAVHPDWQRHGVGHALLSYLEVQAEAQGCRGISILGDPAYYGRFGYQPAADWQILPPAGIPGEFFLFKALDPAQMAGVSGALSYDPAFGI